MPEGELCNKKPIETQEQLQALLNDRGGEQYYSEMEKLDVVRSVSGG